MIQEMLACQKNEGYLYLLSSSTNTEATAPEVKYTTPTLINQSSSLKQFKIKQAFTCRVCKIMISGFEKIKFT
jgi:hypothetical protein